MLFHLYRSFLRLFPARHRSTFGREMSAVFQQRQAEARKKGVLHAAIFSTREFVDLLFSAVQEQGRMVKRWAVRAQFCEHPASPRSFSTVPTFYTCGSYSPRRSALIHGGLLSLATFSAVCLAITHSADHGILLIGSHHHSRSNLFEAQSPTVAPTDLASEVRVKPERGRPKDVWSKMLSLLSGTPVLPQSQPQKASDKESAGRQLYASAASAGGKDPKTGIKLKLDPATPVGLWSNLRGLLSAIPFSLSSHPAALLKAPAARQVASSGPQAAESQDEEWDDPRAGLPAVYFRVILVLAALDSDHDGIISADEIASAPAALMGLDRNHDGKLSPEECGQGLADNPVNPQFLKHAHLEFIHFHPVLDALDDDHDGEISAREIQNAAAALKTLDKNGDGRLTQDEVLPDPIVNAVGLVMRLDANGDGRISKEERTGEHGSRYRELLDAADQNQDGFVTREELTNEIRRRAVLTGILVQEQK
jgi:Ca2+-binding EF-hand superfamily protein